MKKAMEDFDNLSRPALDNRGFPLTPAKLESKTFVDDTSTLIRGTLASVCDACMRVGRKYKQMAIRLKLKLSPKAELQTSTPNIAKALVEDLRAEGIFFKTPVESRDLGATTSLGKTMNLSLLRARNKIVLPKITKISRLAQTNRSARKLYSGSGFSSNTYGHPVSGITENMLIGMERKAVNCSGITPQGRCRFTALVLAFGPRGHPRGRVIKETFTAWFKVLKELEEQDMTDILHSFWTEASDLLKNRYDSQKPNIMEQAIASFIHNIISLLIKVGWNPKSFNVWIDPRGDEWQLIGSNRKTAAHIIIQHIVDDSNLIQLKRAGQHYNAKGIELGVDWSASLQQLRTYKNKNNYSRWCALETIQAAASWFLARAHVCHPDVSPICSECEEADQDDLHAFWTCYSY